MLVLEHSPAIQVRKEGVFVSGGKSEERLEDTDYQLSEWLVRDGITWAWFNENWAFGNGVTVHKTIASPEIRTVVHGTNMGMDEFLKAYGPTRLGDLVLERKHIRTEGWETYEARWLPGTCPQENHQVHLTWLVTKHPLPQFVQQSLHEIIELGYMADGWRGQFSEEKGKHFSEIRRYDGEPAFSIGAPR